MPQSSDRPSLGGAVSRCHSRDRPIFRNRAIHSSIALPLSHHHTPVLIHTPPNSAFRCLQSYSSPPASASSTCAPTSSKSRSLSALNGRFMPRSSITGSSRPSIRITKLPFPGFSAFITTSASDPFAERYFTILLARVLNADHCLHASMLTTSPPFFAAGGALAFLAAGFAGFFALPASALAGDSFLEDERVVLAMVRVSIEVKTLKTVKTVPFIRFRFHRY
mmetsp:Transcript_12158/g.27857  ORF Transcript_12158/g.27857 Transcript_12158/m.27857 type:complete len:222 (-) Transcript_12158:13-678(-)